MRRDFTSVSPVVSGQRDDDVQDRTRKYTEKHKRRDGWGCCCGRSAVRGTDNTSTTTNTKVNSKESKSDVVEDNDEDNDDVDDDNNFVR